jgi:hypothetical protein
MWRSPFTQALLLPAAALALVACGSSSGSGASGGSGSGSDDDSGGSAAQAGSSSGGGGGQQSSAGQSSGGSAVNASGAANDAEAGAGSGEAGASGESVHQSCQAGVMLGAPAKPSYDVLNDTQGENGTFVDMCDAEGNLVEYVCQYTPTTPQDPGQYTGDVIPTMVNCGGKCTDGTCYVSKSCPEGNDEVTWVSASATSVVIDNPRAQVRYTCTTRNSPYGFDCNAPSLAGTKAKVNSVGPCSTTTDLSVDTPDNGTGTTDCVYDCTEQPL